MQLQDKTLRELAVLAKELLGEGASPTADKLLEIHAEVCSRGKEAEVRFVHTYLDLFSEPKQAE